MLNRDQIITSAANIAVNTLAIEVGRSASVPGHSFADYFERDIPKRSFVDSCLGMRSYSDSNINQSRNQMCSGTTNVGLDRNLK